jgi:8-oxo-dGTP pyrophosphatase MutT (NUDIX family)
MWSLDRVRDALGQRIPARVEGPVSMRVAVALILREGPSGLELLFMRRAEHENDPWSGHISFPGGRAEPGEDDPLATAIRETTEETGIDLKEADLLGALDEVRAMARGRALNLAIAPFVFRLREPVEGTPNDEVVSLHWLPLERLLAPESRSTTSYPHGDAPVRLPCLQIDELTIWGLTYRMFDDLRELLAAAGAPGIASTKSP